MDKLLIVGAGGFGRVVLEHAAMKYECAFVDDGKELGSNVDGIEVIGKISDLSKLTDYKNLIVAIGDNKLREQVYVTAKEYGFLFPNIVAQSVYISPHTTIGNGCVFLNNAVIQNGAHVGNGVILNPGVELHHDSFIDDYSLVYTNSVIRSLTHVGKRVWIGSNVTIRTGESINDDAVIEDMRISPTFEELWAKIVSTKKLPDQANIDMYGLFSEETKKQLLRSEKNAIELADLLNGVIDEINRGSIERVDVLTRRALSR